MKPLRLFPLALAASLALAPAQEHHHHTPPATAPSPNLAPPQPSDTPTLTLPEIEKIALASNPTVAQAEANLRAAQALIRQAGLYPNPTVGYYGDQIRGGLLGGGEQGGFASQTIVLGGKLAAARRLAQLDARAAETSSAIQRQRILTDVDSLFYHVLAAQRLLEVNQNLDRLAADAVHTSEQLGNVGQADRPDILQAEVEREQAAVSLRLARRNLQAAWSILAAAIGKPDLPQAPLAGSLEAIPDLDFNSSLAAALRDSPEITLARQSIDRAQAALSQARKAPIPDLQLTGILTQSFEPLGPSGRLTGMMGGAQVGVELPLFNRNQGNIAAARDSIESAKQDLARIQLQLQRRLSALFRDYDSARLTALQYKTEMLPRAERAYSLYRANYENMAAAYPQVLISQRTLFQLQASYVQALDDAWQSALLIRGFGLSGALDSPAMPAPSAAPMSLRAAPLP